MRKISTWLLSISAVLAYSLVAYATEKTAAHAGAGGAHWKTPVVELHVNEEVEDAIPGGYYALVGAATAWQDSQGYLPTLLVTSSKTETLGYTANAENHNTVTYAKGGSDLADGALAITIVTYDSHTDEILDADILINGKFEFETEETSQQGIKRYDLQNVLTHEIGHFLGLPENMDDLDSTMYAYSATGETIKRNLAASDEAAISALYADNISVRHESLSCGMGLVRRASSQPDWLYFAIGLMTIIGLAHRRAEKQSAKLFAQIGGLCAVAFFTFSNIGEDSANFTSNESIVLHSSSHWENGLIVSELLVEDKSDGQRHQIQLLGGQVGDISQQVGALRVPTAGSHLALSAEQLISVERESTAMAESLGLR